MPPKRGPGRNLGSGAEARQQVTLEEILYPPPSWEMDAARRSSPKVCPVNHLEFYDDDGSASSAGVDLQMSVSVVSQAASFVRSQNGRGASRRVSFRSPDESDVFVIPARSNIQPLMISTRAYELTTDTAD